MHAASKLLSTRHVCSQICKYLQIYVSLHPSALEENNNAPKQFQALWTKTKPTNLIKKNEPTTDDVRKHKLCIQYLIADMVITKPFLTNETNKMYQVIGFCAHGPSLQIQLTPILHKRQQADGCGFIFNQQIWGVILIFQFDAQREIKKKRKKAPHP